ncbi:gfo/Idh/MocA family oxidoreductase, partial [Flavobacteriaceae bacterium PRS1]
MKVVVIGYGSIGKRHVKNLISLGIHDIILCRKKAKGNDLGLLEIENVEEIIKINPDFVIVSNPTFLHFQTLEFLIQNQFNILCEKPLLHSPEEWNLLKSLLGHYNGFSKIIFNLRYHPCIIKVKEIIASEELGKINFARFFVGQYLPDWRPDINHLESYSAKKGMGGGVVLDLVHEIDIAEYLLGQPQGKIHSIATKVSDVTEDSNDIAEIIYQTSNNEIVNIHLDYLYRGFARNFLISGKEYNLHCDLLENTIQFTGNQNKQIKTFEFKDFVRNDMYYNLLEDYIKGLTNPEHQTKLPSFYENE